MASENRFFLIVLPLGRENRKDEAVEFMFFEYYDDNKRSFTK